MKSYCTQNNGNCANCSLVNYNRDCQNNPIPGSETNIFWIATEHITDCCDELAERAWDVEKWIWKCSRCDTTINSPIK